MILRMIAILFGIALIFAGVAGFLPAFMKNNLLFGIFEINTMHNIVNLVSGVIAIMAATSVKYARLFFQIFGIVFALITIAGFVLHGNLPILMMHFNLADNLLHLAIALVSIYLGFSRRFERPSVSP